jgi:hypothetical protein
MRGEVTEQLRAMRTPRKADIDLTASCNLCRYCYVSEDPAVPYEDLLSEEWLRFFEELGRCAVMDLVPAGRECTRCCTGDCPALAHTLIGVVNDPGPDICLRPCPEQGGWFAAWSHRARRTLALMPHPQSGGASSLHRCHR